MLPEEYFVFLGDDFLFILVFIGSTVVTCLALLLCFYGPLYLTFTCSLFPTLCFRFLRFLVRQWLHVMSVYRGLGISRIFCVKVDLGSLSGGRFRLAGFAGYNAPRAVFPSSVPCVFPVHDGWYGPEGQFLRAHALA